jgi:A/G-specific adenine glycosylase
MKPTSAQISALYHWYREHQRPLPWRKTKDAYSIWISETMLQQTTTQVVIPYYERFLKELPALKDLAEASQEKVYALWAGLGYYSRARNLQKAAKALHAVQGFPRTAQALMEFPGFGPYTSRAVSSLAFEEQVGVLDGNVIRVLTRVHDLDVEWWKTAARRRLQELADQWVQGFPSSQMNQALMELGATICTPTSPSCLLCPLKSSCRARKNDTLSLRPKSKPRPSKKRLLWTVRPLVKDGAIFLTMNHPYPILKSQLLPPGEMKTITDKPKTFDFKHTITHHEIFVHVDSSSKKRKAEEGEWVRLKDLQRKSPSSLVRKVVSTLGAKENFPVFKSDF